jgi:CBS domain-containing protein
VSGTVVSFFPSVSTPLNSRSMRVRLSFWGNGSTLRIPSKHGLRTASGRGPCWVGISKTVMRYCIARGINTGFDGTGRRTTYGDSFSFEPNRKGNDRLAKDRRSTTGLRVQHILAQKATSNFTISERASIEDTISHMVENRLSSCLATSDDGGISGIFTARDIFRFIHSMGEGYVRRIKGHTTRALRRPVGNLMTDRSKMIHCSPGDLARRCREIMYQLKIRNLPVLEEITGDVVGIITMKVHNLLP